jgi:hypothetical protein
MSATSSYFNLIGESMKLKFGKEKPILTETIYKEVLAIPKKTFISSTPILTTKA